MKIERFGDDLVVRLPVGVVEALGLEAGDEIALHASGPALLEVSLVSKGGQFAPFESWADSDNHLAPRAP